MSKKKLPFMKFYPSDYRADPALRMCSLAARGLWMDMLCLMHDADPHGHLIINSKPLTERMLASLTGTDESTVADLLSELEVAGVYSRSNKGVIYSRRMVRDEAISNLRSKSGKKGGKSTSDKYLNKNNISDLLKQNSSKGLSLDTRNQILETRKTKSGLSSGYWFKGEVIRLNEPDFRCWQERYPGSEAQFWDYLSKRDEWYATQPPERRKNWFIATANAIGTLQSDNVQTISKH